MRTLARRAFLSLGACACLAASGVFAQEGPGPYVCPPCDCSMHDRVFDAPGTCPACGMTLIPKGAALPFEPGVLAVGTGAFLTGGGRGHEAQRITVHYHRPASFTATSPVLLVLPGAGRNADQYLDAWIPASEARGVLVAALGYPEADWDFAAYQMGGVIRDLQIDTARNTSNKPGVVRLRDEDIRFAVERDPAAWLFPDFDRIFALIAKASGARATTYDLFGHSAGGQILSRLPLFRPQSKAARIVAANAGLYTQPSLEIAPPFGLKDSGVTAAMLKAGLASRLTLLLGEADNDGEAGGIQLHTPIADSFGETRLERGRYAFAAGRARAAAMGAPFNWTLETVPGVGHDYRPMSRAAAKLLYG